MKKSLFLLTLVLVAALGLSCAGKIKNIVLHDDDPEHIWLQYFVDDNDEPVSMGYDHPAELTTEQVAKLLTAAEYEEFSFMAWRSKGRVFIDSEVEKLAKPLAEALAQATPNQWVHFAVTGQKVELFFKTRHLTDGICFIQDGRFNLVLGNMNVELINPDKELYKRDPRDRLYTDSLRLKVKPDLGIALPPIVQGDPWLEKERRNWLTYDLVKFFAAGEPAAEPVEATPEPQPDATERLQKLKELYDNGLISEEEYEQKRKEILEDL